MYGKRRATTKRGYRKTRTTYRKKSRRSTRYPRPTRAISSIGSKWKNPLPSSCNYRLKYQDSGFSAALAAGNGYTVYNVYSGNSLYDPDVTGVGVQPYAYDQLCGDDKPFGFYIVYASKIKIYPKVTTTDDTKCRALRCIVCPVRYSAGIPTRTEFEDLCQIPGARRLAINSIDDQKGCVASYFSTKRMAGTSNLDPTAWGTSYDGSPGNRWYWFVQFDDVTSAQEITVKWDVQITYYCKLIKRDDQNES